MQFGRCFFKMPPGFELLEPGSRLTCNYDDNNTICITLISKYSNIACEPLLSENPQDLNIGAFPAVLMFNTFISEQNPNPEAYAQLKAKELAKHLDQFQIVFCNPCKIRENKGVKVQFSFVTNFKMEQIQIIWAVKSEIAVTSMITSCCNINNKWRLMEEFAESIRL